ncbi:MAG TPA: MFS transporter, partial [Verrucomicrobiae bacterium]|nr:MFS transporter [Verrucomicrobiae bacterium]
MRLGTEMNEPERTENPVATRATNVRFAVLGWLCAAAAFAYVSRNAIAVAESTVRGELGLTKEQSGWLMSAFFISYAIFQIPGAWLGQRLGARRALAMFAVAWSLATAAMAAGWFFMLFVARIAKGLSQAGLFPVSTGVVANWFPRTGRAFATGALASFMSVGGAAGAALTGWLVVAIGWRWMFALYSVPGLLWAVWFWNYFRNTPQEHRGVNVAERRIIEGETCRDEQTKAVILSTPWLQLLSSPAMWCICGQQFFRAAGYMFFTSWFATYLQESRGVTITTSGVLTMLPLLAVVAGSLVGGVVSDAILRRTGSLRLARQALGGCSLGLCAVLTLSAYFFADALAAVLIISAGSFFAAMAGPCGYTITIDMGGEHVPTVNSVMNMCGNIGAMLFPLAVPWLLRESGSWNVVLLSFGGLYVAAALCWWGLRPEGNVFA